MKDFLEDVLLTTDDISKIVERLGKEITNDYKDKNLLVVCILKGSILFTSDLIKKIDLYNCEVDFMCISSYVGTKNLSGKVNVIKDLDKDLSKYDVLIIEDILESGYTLEKVINLIKDKNPKSIKSCTLLDKPMCRKVDVEADYVGTEIPNRFVIGYGMDYNGKYRNLPFVGVLNKKYI